MAEAQVLLSDLDEEGLPEGNLPMTDEELAAFLDHEDQNSVGVDSGEISSQRADSMERYLGQPYGNERPGSSSVVSRDVTDAVEWSMPQLMSVFFSGETVAELDPDGEEDVQGTELETKYLNHVFLKKNNGFLEGYQFIKDALINKNGVFGAWVEESVKEKFESYEGLTEDELLMVLQDPSAELVEHSTFVEEVLQANPETGEAIAVPVEFHDVKIRFATIEKIERVQAIPPEEFRVSRRTRLDLQKSPYVCHVTDYTKGELRELIESLGVDVDPDMAFAEASSSHLGSSPERLARHSIDGTDPDNRGFNSTSDTVSVYKEFTLVDANGDGYEERLATLRVGRKILWREEVRLVPFASASPVIIPHKFNGLSLADLVKDLAEIKTVLTRNILDNIYKQNNGRMAVLDGQVELEDLLHNRPGGVVREFVSGAVRPLVEGQIPQQAFEMLGYLDSVRDERTGVSKLTQGLDPNALSSNVAFGAVAQVMTAAQQRIKLMAMLMAEGFKQIFWILHELSRTEVGTAQKIRFNEEFMEVDPSRFLERKDFSIRVGLGNIEQDIELGRLGMIAQDMQMIAAQGGVGRIIQEGNVYNLAAARAKAAGEKAFGRFYTDPQQLPPPEQQPSEIEVEQFKMQADQQFELQKLQMQLESDEKIELAKLAMKADELALKERELVAEIKLETEQGRGVELG